LPELIGGLIVRYQAFSVELWRRALANFDKLVILETEINNEQFSQIIILQIWQFGILWVNIETQAC